jgi:hypothetical protein
MSTYALINTVTPSPIVKRATFSGDPPELAEAKGLKWIADNPPAFDALTQTLQEPETVPVDAEEITYTVITNPSYVAAVHERNEDALVERKIAAKRAKGDRIGAIEDKLKHKGI